MSSGNQIRILYGHGEIIYGEMGVDLRSFPEIIVDHPNPEGANISDLKQ